MNLLKNERSIYLKQHENNPVNWYSYSYEAIEKAQKENKPIFLSVGYSTCHWCHVMAHESFESQEIAEVLNKHFICIKVDREEHPDLDQYYQKACQLFTGRGGWPLSVFLTPQMKPFFVGTYFPNKSRQGMPSFKEVLEKLNHAYTHEAETVKANAESITQSILKEEKPNQEVKFEGHFPHPASLMQALESFQDNKNGGYGDAPKFPHFAFFEWAIEQTLEGMLEQKQAEHIVKSVEKILCGGIFDHAKGGIHRYSVDSKWLVPNFEKILYNQYGLVSVLAKTSLFHATPLVCDALYLTLEYLKTQMQADAGFFFAAQDADSEGKEGLYFSFTEEEFKEIIAALPKEHQAKAEEIKTWFQISSKGNFEHNLNVISLAHEKLEELQKKENWEIIRQIRQLIVEERKNRIPPHTDNKGISSWNFHLVSALVDVIQYCRIDVIKKMAHELIQSSLEGIHKEFLTDSTQTGKLILKQTNTKAESKQLFENYVAFSQMQLRLYEVSGIKTYLNNGLHTLDFIFEEYYKDGKFYTRPIKNETMEPFANLEVSLFDQSYRSSLATFILLVRKWYPVTLKHEQLEIINELLRDKKKEILMNPFGYGEALRAVTYPQEIYRKLEVPVSWLKEQQFIQFLPFFSNRFTLIYHEDQKNFWQICHSSACERQGNDIESFVKVFSQNKETNETT